MGPAAARPPAGFDRLARHFHWLERLALQGSMTAARTALLEELGSPGPAAPGPAAPHRALLAGEGDGRLAAALARRFPELRLDVVDASAAMLARAARRLDFAQARCRFAQVDLCREPAPGADYDLISTCFLLDCFEGAELSAVCDRLAASAAARAQWLQTDFRVPPAGAARLAGRAQLALLYPFFRATTGLAARRLEDPRRHLETAGFHLDHERLLRAGTLTSQLWRRG